MEDLRYVWRQHFRVLGHLLGSDSEGRATGESQVWSTCGLVRVGNTGGMGAGTVSTPPGSLSVGFFTCKLGL